MIPISAVEADIQAAQNTDFFNFLLKAVTSRWTRWFITGHAWEEIKFGACSWQRKRISKSEGKSALSPKARKISPRGEHANYSSKQEKGIMFKDDFSGQNFCLLPDGDAIGTLFGIPIFDPRRINVGMLWRPYEVSIGSAKMGKFFGKPPKKGPLKTHEWKITMSMETGTVFTLGQSGWWTLTVFYLFICWQDNFYMFVADPNNKKLGIQVNNSLRFADFTVGTTELRKLNINSQASWL